MTLSEEQILNLRYIFTFEANNKKREHGWLQAIATMRALASVSNNDPVKMLNYISHYLIILSLVDLASMVGVSENRDNKCVLFNYNSEGILCAVINTPDKDISIIKTNIKSLVTLVACLQNEQTRLNINRTQDLQLAPETLHRYYNQHKSALLRENFDPVCNKLLQLFVKVVDLFKSSDVTDAEIYKYLASSMEPKVIPESSVGVKLKAKL